MALKLWSAVFCLEYFYYHHLYGANGQILSGEQREEPQARGLGVGCHAASSRS